MLSTQVRGAVRVGRLFSTQAAAKYNVVKFQQENMQNVVQEVPDVPFYFVGNPQTEAYPFANLAISESALPGIPETYFNSPAKAEWKVSQLENGLKIASIDKSGVTSKVALYVNAGARHESADFAGAAHMTELMAYRSTAHLSYLRQMKVAEAVSGHLDVDASREHIAYTAEANRHFLSHLVTLVSGNVLLPRLLRWEVDDVKKRADIIQDRIARTPAFHVQEVLHEAAWFNNTLGNARYSSKKNPNFKNTVIKDFIKSRYDPKNMTLVGVNVDHEEFSKWAMRAFVDYTAVTSETTSVPAKYTGGAIVKPVDGATSTQIAVGYKMGGSTSKDAIIARVVKAALGGAHISHTYATGASTAPSRIASAFKNAKDAELIAHTYSDSGVWGIRVEVAPKDTKSVLETLATQFKNLSSLTEADWTRAKNVVKGEIAAATETTDGAIDFVAKQLLFNQEFQNPAAIIAAVEKVSAADVSAFVKNLSEPAVAIVGATKYAPHSDEIKAILRK